MEHGPTMGCGVVKRSHPHQRSLMRTRLAIHLNRRSTREALVTPSDRYMGGTVAGVVIFFPCRAVASLSGSYSWSAHGLGSNTGRRHAQTA